MHYEISMPRKVQVLVTALESLMAYTTPRKNVCATWCQLFRRLSKTQNGSDSMFCLFCENASGIMNVAPAARPILAKFPNITRTINP